MSRVSRGFRIAGYLVKTFFMCLVAFVCAALLWRVFSSSDPDSMKSVYINDAVYEAYNSSGGALYMFAQEQDPITRGEDNAGYFGVTRAVFIPEANQIHVVLRYNNSTIKHLVEDYGLENTPERGEDLFDISLFFSVDLTPDNKEDNATISETGTRTFRCSSQLVEREQKNLYNYRKLVFDLDECGEDLSELLDSGLLLAVYADVYYVEDMDLDKEAYGTLCLYDYITEKDEIKLSSDDKKAIEGWKPDDR